jgi:hypothetical protein
MNSEIIRETPRYSNYEKTYIEALLRSLLSDSKATPLHPYLQRERSPYPLSFLTRDSLRSVVAWVPHDTDVANLGDVVVIHHDYGYTYSKEDRDAIERAFPFKIFRWSIMRDIGKPSEVIFTPSLNKYLAMIEDIQNMSLAEKLTDPRWWVREFDIRKVLKEK